MLQRCLNKIYLKAMYQVVLISWDIVVFCMLIHNNQYA